MKPSDAERDDLDGRDRLIADKPALFALEADMKQARKEMRAIRKARGRADLDRELGRMDDEAWREERDVLRDAEAIVVERFNARWNAEAGTTR